MKLPGGLGVLKDRRVQIGAAVAAVLGLFVLVRRGGGDAAAASDGGQSITPATYDSSGIDGYNAIAQIGEAWGAEFADYAAQLGTITDKLDAIQNPVKSTTPPAGYGWYKVAKGDGLASIAKKYGLSVATLKKYNSASALNRLTAGEYVRVRYATGTKPK